MQNLRTGEFEEMPDPLTDEKARDYIPQNVPCQTLYGLYRLKGMDPLDAMIEVLTIASKKKTVVPSRN